MSNTSPWIWLKNIRVGDKLDAFENTYSRWNVATIKRVELSNNSDIDLILYIHYDGYSDFWDECVTVDFNHDISNKLATLHKHTKCRTEWELKGTSKINAYKFANVGSNCKNCGTLMCICSINIPTENGLCEPCLILKEQKLKTKNIQIALQYYLTDDIISIITQFAAGAVIVQCNNYPNCRNEIEIKSEADLEHTNLTLPDTVHMYYYQIQQNQTNIDDSIEQCLLNAFKSILALGLNLHTYFSNVEIEKIRKHLYALETNRLVNHIYFLYGKYLRIFCYPCCKDTMINHTHLTKCRYDKCENYDITHNNGMELCLNDLNKICAQSNCRNIVRNAKDDNPNRCVFCDKYFCDTHLSVKNKNKYFLFYTNTKYQYICDECVVLTEWYNYKIRNTEYCYICQRNGKTQCGFCNEYFCDRHFCIVCDECAQSQPWKACNLDVEYLDKTHESQAKMSCVKYNKSFRRERSIKYLQNTWSRLQIKSAKNIDQVDMYCYISPLRKRVNH